MLKQIDALLKRLSPKLHGYLKGVFKKYKKKTNPTLSESELINILHQQLKINKGDVLFVHSSMRNLYLDFDKSRLLDILLSVVGPQGTLLFPCWQFNSRAEDYIQEHDIVFDVRNSPSAMGKIPDVLRANPAAKRSFHPTNSIVAIGRYANELTQGHETGIYPCGEQSPFYKMMQYQAKILGIGVTVDNLTFVHTIEDTMKEQFPVKTRNEEIYDCKCIGYDGSVKMVKTLVASKAISHRDVYGFFKKHISTKIYRSPKIKGMEFFSLNSVEGFDAIRELAKSNKSIYNF